MALTTERIKELWDAYRAALPRYLGFAKAIEAEVRKQDDALIRQMLEALEPEGVLVFKWNETQVKVGEVLALAPAKPLFGQVSGRSGMTHWLVFMKP